MALLDRLWLPAPDELERWFDGALDDAVENAGRHTAIVAAAKQYREALLDIARYGYRAEVDRRARSWEAAGMGSVPLFTPELLAEEAEARRQLEEARIRREQERKAATQPGAGATPSEPGNEQDRGADNLGGGQLTAEETEMGPPVPVTGPHVDKSADLSPARSHRWNAEQRQRFGRTVRRLRELKGWSIDELARQLKCSSDAILEWEKGRSCPHPYRLPNIARTLGVQPADLLPD